MNTSKQVVGFKQSHYFLWCNLGYVIGKRVLVQTAKGLKKAVLGFEYQLQSCGGAVVPKRGPLR